MLTVYRGNRLERLADRLAQIVRVPAGAPLAGEVILVHNRGMARWLSLRVAERLGVCANTRFPLPSSFLWETFRRVLRGVPETSLFDPEVLTWRVMGMFDSLPESKAFYDLHGYLAGEGDERRYELAYRIADTFDRYLVYRPDWIEKWEKGKDKHWQALLWRELSKDDRAIHRVRLHREFLSRVKRAIAEGASDALGLPSRILLFGVAAVPPVYVDLFDAISRICDVHVFLLDPCREYWGDIVSDRVIARRGADAEKEYLETGNTLLASMGGLGRDFIDKVLECDEKLEEEWFADPAVDEPDGPSLLRCVQSDVLNLINRGDGEDEHPRVAIDPGDDSIQVHSTHGPMRELEVLYDRLLDLFRAEPDLEPSDVVVMTPDIEAYAPYVEAVFGTMTDPARRIPYAIADRSPRSDSPLVDVFFDLLGLPGSRFEATRVAGLLESSAVRRRFGFQDDDLEAVSRWIRETGIRWGVDESSRSELSLPATRDHTWRAGLDRMMLGYAMPGGGYHMFAGTLPYDEIEGRDARILGRLQAYASALFDLDEDLSRPRRPEAWAATLTRVIDRFLAPVPEEEYELRRIREVAQALADSTRIAGFDGELSLDAILAHLRRSLDTPDPVAGFLGGGVTFCAMVPMRSIPFRVVCLIGLDDARYPRSRKPLGFDLMGRDFRRGDRSGRDDDRYLFLEAVLSARRCLYISYVGQSIRDNNAIPPSVLVAELLDAIDRGFAPADDESASLALRIVTRHPLQAFSRRYFTGEHPELFSYSVEQCEAARKAGRGEKEATAFLGERLPEAAEEWTTVTIDQLVRFFANPTRFFVRSRLGLYLGTGEGLLDTREPFDLNWFDAQDLREELIELREAGDDLDSALQCVRATGILPHGNVGATLFEREVDEAARFGEKLDAALGGAEDVDPVDVDLLIGDTRIVGRLGGLTTRGLTDHRTGSMQGRDHPKLWIGHLLLNAAAPEGVPLSSRFVHERGERILDPIEDAPKHLADLLAIYREGLQRPLPLFARSSYEYARTRLSKGEHEAENAAWRKWNTGKSPEGAGAYFALVFRDGEPLGAEFQQLARRVYDPMLEHARDLSDAEAKSKSKEGVAS